MEAKLVFAVIVIDWLCSGPGPVIVHESDSKVFLVDKGRLRSRAVAAVKETKDTI